MNPHLITYRDLFNGDVRLYKHRLNDLLTWDRNDADRGLKIEALNELIAEAKPLKLKPWGKTK